MADNDQSKKNSNNKADDDVSEKIEKKIIDSIKESTTNGEELEELDINIKISEEETKNSSSDDLNAQTDSQKKHEKETLEALEEYEGKIKKRQEDDKEYFERYEKQREEEAKRLEEWDGQNEDKEEKEKEDEEKEKEDEDEIPEIDQNEQNEQGDENEFATNLHKDQIKDRTADGEDESEESSTPDEKSGGEDKGDNEQNTISDDEQRAAQNKLSNDQVAAKKKKAEEEKEEKSDEDSDEGVKSLATKASKQLLKKSWISLLITGGLSVLLAIPYINLHGLGRITPFKNLLCKFGTEWTPEITDVGKIKKKGPGCILGLLLGILEVIGIIILDVALFFLIVGGTYIIYDSIIRPLIRIF